jgi:hypothetical protein
MYRAISSHGNRGDAVQLGDLLAVLGGKGFIVSVEEGGHLKFRGCRHRFPQELKPFDFMLVRNYGQVAHRLDFTTYR